MLLGARMRDWLGCHADDSAGHQLIATVLLHRPGDELVRRHPPVRRFRHHPLLIRRLSCPCLILALAQVGAQGGGLALLPCGQSGAVRGGLRRSRRRQFLHQSFHGSNSPSTPECGARRQALVRGCWDRQLPWWRVRGRDRWVSLALFPIILKALWSLSILAQSERRGTAQSAAGTGDHGGIHGGLYNPAKRRTPC